VDSRLMETGKKKKKKKQAAGVHAEKGEKPGGKGGKEAASLSKKEKEKKKKIPALRPSCKEKAVQKRGGEGGTLIRYRKGKSSPASSSKKKNSFRGKKGERRRGTSFEPYATLEGGKKKKWLRQAIPNRKRENGRKREKKKKTKSGKKKGMRDGGGKGKRGNSPLGKRAALPAGGRKPALKREGGRGSAVAFSHLQRKKGGEKKGPSPAQGEGVEGEREKGRKPIIHNPQKKKGEEGKGIPCDKTPVPSPSGERREKAVCVVGKQKRQGGGNEYQEKRKPGQFFPGKGGKRGKKGGKKKGKGVVSDKALPLKGKGGKTKKKRGKRGTLPGLRGEEGKRKKRPS